MNVSVCTSRVLGAGATVCLQHTRVPTCLKVPGMHRFPYSMVVREGEGQLCPQWLMYVDG